MVSLGCRTSASSPEFSAAIFTVSLSIVIQSPSSASSADPVSTCTQLSATTFRCTVCRTISPTIPPGPKPRMKRPCVVGHFKERSTTVIRCRGQCHALKRRLINVDLSGVFREVERLKGRQHDTVRLFLNLRRNLRQRIIINIFIAVPIEKFYWTVLQLFLERFRIRFWQKLLETLRLLNRTLRGPGDGRNEPVFDILPHTIP